MTREQSYSNVPEQWVKRRDAGLCPVCAKSKEDFEPRRQVYCSAKCADKFADTHVTWNEVRAKMLEKTSKCAKCGMSRKKWEAQEEKRVKELTAGFTEKYAREIKELKLELLKNEEKRFIEKIKEIEEMSFSDWRFQWDLERKIGIKLKTSENAFQGFEVDHIEPVYKGGAMWDENNLQVLCLSCHKVKTKVDVKNRKAMAVTETKQGSLT